MNSYDVNQLDKLELKRIAIGKKLHKGDSSVSVADDLTINRDLFVDRDIHIVNQIQLGKYTDYGEEMPGAMRVVGTLSVSGNTFLGTNVQTTTVRNDIVVEDTLSVAGSVTVATCQNELPSNFMQFTRTRHATDDNTHVLIEEGDSLGSILFKGSDGTDWKKYVDIQTLATSVEQDNEGGKIQFNILSGGGAHSGDDGTTNTSDMFNLFSIGGENKSQGTNNQVVVNEAGINTDFRVESDLNENMIFVDSLANKIGIARDSPEYTLDIQGNSRISDHLLLNTISVGADSHGNHKAVVREDLGGSDMGALIYNTQLALFSTAKQSMNMGVMTDGKGVIQVIDNNNPSITYADLGIQPLGGQIAIGKQSANVVLDIEATDSIRIPVGNTSERPAANSSDHVGYLRYNSELKRFEGYGQSLDQQNDTNEWITLSGLKDADNDTYITVENQQGADNDQIKFFVEDRQEMTLDKSGYLGIGVNNPVTRLHVESNDPSYNNTEPIALFRSANKDTSVRIEGKGETYIELANVDTTGDNLNSWGIGMNDDKNLYFNWKTNGTINYDTNINERNAMTIMQNGNVGINTNEPKVTFEITGEDALRIPVGNESEKPSLANTMVGQIRYNSEINRFEGYGQSQDQQSNVNEWISLSGLKDADNDTYITVENSGNADNDEIKFFTSGSERAIIKSDGKIGINDSVPSEMLDVTGNIRATGHIKVEPSGNPNYSTKMIEVIRENDSWNPVTIEQTLDTRENAGWGAAQLEFKTRNGSADGSNTLTTPATTKMMITSDGRIGMGDITVTPTDVKLPTARLHVYDNTEGEESMFVLQRNITNFGGNNDGPSMEFRIHDTNNNNQLTQAKILTYDSGVGGSNSAGLSFQTRTSASVRETLRIAHDGRIAVGNGLQNFNDSELFENKARINVTSGGILLKNYQGNFAADQRIQISNSVLENEISGIGGGTHAADVGHLRLSAGGGTNTSNKSYIDLYGYQSNIITFGTKGTERAVIDEVGRVGIGNTNPSSYLHVEATGAQEPIALFKSTNNDSSVRIEGTGESYLELANVNTTGDSSNSWGIGMNNDKNLYFNWKTNSTLDSDTNVNERNAFTIMQNGNIGVNKLVPNVTFDIEGEDAIRIPRGTTAQRPTTLGLGQIRYNTQLHTFEGYGAGNAWGSLGGVKDVDRDTYITAEDSAGADNDELKFYTNQFEENVTPTTVPRMIIKNDGKIGIHTSTPLVKFQVTDQSVLTGTDITSGTASIYGSSGKSSYQILNVSHTNQSQYISIGYNEIAKQGTYDGHLKINNQKNNDIIFATNNTNYMTLKNDGKLGIGVSSPDTLLHVQKSGAQEPIAIFESTNNDSSIRIQGKGETYLEIANTNTTGDTANSWGIGMNDDKNLYFNWKTNGTLNYDTNINERNAMTIMQNGNVGINKAAPNVTFDIEGEDAIRIPRGTTAQRPTTLGLGQIRYNTQLHTFEGYGAGNAWGSLGGVKDVDRDTYITAEDSAGADNDELKFYTGQFEENVTPTTVPRMIIKNDGKIGVNVINPLYQTHVNGTLGVEDSVTLQDTLSVSGTTNLTGNTIIGLKDTTTDQLHVEGTTNITGATNLESTLDVTGASILNSTLSVSGISRFSSDLTTVGKISARHTAYNVGVEITPFGGNTSTNGGGRVFFRESNNSNNYGFSLGFNGGDGLNPSNLTWPSNTFCISRHDGTSSGEIVLAIDRTSNNVGLGTGIPTSNLHIKQTSGSNDCMIKIEADGGNNSNKPNTGIEFITNDGVPNLPTSNQPVYTSSKILSGWNQGEGSYDQSFFKIQTHHTDSSTLNDSFTIKGPDVGINNNSPQFTLDIDGTLNTTGATTLKNTLGVTGATTLESTLNVTGSTFINNNVGIRTTPGTNCSLDIASISDTKDNIVRIRQASTSHNSQIMFSRLDNNGNDYGPEIIFDKNQSPTHSVDSLNLISTSGNIGMNITWDGKVGIGSVNSTGENLYVDGTFKASNNSDIGGTLDVTGATTINNTLTVSNHTDLGSTMTMKGTGDVVLKLEADTDDSGGESDNPLIHLSQDKGITNTYFGIVGPANSGMNPSIANYAYINSNRGIHLGRDGVPSLTIGSNNNVHIGNTANAGEKLKVSGTFRATDNSTIGGTFDVTGATTLNSSLSVASQATFNGNAETIVLRGSGTTPHTYIGFYPDGTTTRKGYIGFGGHTLETISIVNQYTNGNIKLGNDTDITGSLDVTGAMSVSTFDSSGATSLATDGGIVNISKSGVMTTVKGTLNVDEGVTMDSTLGVTGVTTLGNTLDVTGATTLNNTLDVTGNTTISSELYVGSKNKINTLSGYAYYQSTNNDSAYISIANDLYLNSKTADITFETGTNSDRRMIIKNDGKLGIGTTAPLSKLHVNGGNITITEGSSNNNGSIQIIPSGPIGNGDSGGRIFFQESGNYGFSLGYNGGNNNSILNWPSNTFCIASHNDNANGVVHVAITRSDGDVGIGTNSPSQKLHVAGSQFISDALHFEAADEDKILFANDTNKSKISHSSGWSVDYHAGNKNSESGIHRFMTSNGSDWVERMRIASNGNVGIGIQPTSKLHIKGSVNSSHFYKGSNEDVYIRGGKDSGDIYLNGDTSGNVGIGTTDPKSKLEVVDSMSVTSVRGSSDPVPNNLKLSSGGFSTAPALYVGKCIQYQNGNGEAALELGVLNSGWGNHGGTLRYRLSTEGGPHRALKFNIERVDCSAGGYFGDPVYSKVLTMKQDSTSRVDMVGISQADPTHKLDVNGTFRASGATTLNNTLGVTGATTLGNTLGVTGATTLSNTLNVSGTTTINNTLSVGDSLFIESNTSKEPIATFKTTGLTDCSIKIESQGESYIELANVHTTTGDSNKSWGIGTNDDKNLHFIYKNNGTINNAANDAMTILSDGKVGIGNKNPNYTLDVDGTMRATGATLLSDTLSVTGETNLNGGLKMDNDKFTVANGTGNTNINGTLDVGGNSTIGGDLTVNGSELRINGNLVVEGTTTTLNTTTLDIKDKDIKLATNSTSNADANGAGFIIEAGATDKEFIYNSTGDKFTTNIPLQIEDALIYGNSNEYAYFKKNSGSGFLQMWDEIYLNSPSSDIYFQTGGANRMFIKSNGNIGIGNISPGKKLDISGTLRASGATTLDSTLSVANSIKCSIISPGEHDIRNEYGNYTTTNFPHPRGIQLNFNRGFSQPIGSSGWSQIAADYCDELALSSWAHDSGGGRNSVSITKYYDIKMVLRRASFSNQNESIGGYGGNTKSNQNYREVVLYDHNNLLNTNGNVKVNGTLEATGDTTLEGELQLGDPTDEKLKIHVDNANNYAILEYTPKDAQGSDLGKGEISLGGSQTNVAHSTGDIQLNTSSTVRMIIKNDGKVGIGTTDPTSNLCIQSTGYTHISNNQHDTQLSIENSSNTTTAFNSKMGIGVMDNGKGTIQVLKAFDSAGYKDLLLQSLGGNVGIGTYSASSNLHIKQVNGSSDCMIKIEADGGDGNKPNTGIEFLTNDGNPSTPTSGTDDVYTSSKILSGWNPTEASYDQSFFKIQTHHQNSSTLNDSFTIKGPNVGINNNSPQNTLDVNGTFHVSGNTSLSGTVTGIGNIVVTGSNIGHHTDTDLLLFAPDKLTVDGTLDVGGISSTGNITTSGILTCNELSPGMGDIGSSYSANHFPSGLGIKLNFGRGFSQSIGSTWTANFYTPNYADEIMFNSYQANSSGGGPTVLSITRADKLRMAVKRADWTNRSQGFGGNTKSNQNYREVVLYDHDNLLNTNGNAKVNGTLEASGATTLESTLSVGGITTLGHQLHVKGDDICLGPDAQPGKSRALVCSTVGGNKKLIINYNGDFNNGVLIESNTKIQGNLEVTGSLSGSAFDSLGASAFNNITESGSNVGIGTTSPVGKLDVRGQIFCESGINIDPDNNNILINTSRHIAHQDNWTPVQLTYSHQGNYGGNLFFNTHNNDGNKDNNVSTKMSILHNGNVGIGTTSPTKKLHVKGNFFVENPTRAGKGMLHSHTTNDSNTSNGCTFLDVGFQEAQNPNETPGTGPVTAIRLGGRNGDGPFNHCVIENNVYGSPENSELLLFKGDGINGADRIRLLSNEIRFDTYTDYSYIDTSFGTARTTNTFNRLTIKQDGKVGVGTGSPSKKLDVNGTFRASGATTLESTLSVGGVLNLTAGTLDAAAHGAVNTELDNKTNTYIEFEGTGAGADTDFALLRQIGTSNNMILALDFHDDSTDGRFKIRRVDSTGTHADTITDLLHVNGTKVEIPGTLEVGGGATGEAYSNIDGHLTVGGNRDNAHLRLGAPYNVESGHPRALVRSNSGNGTLIINYDADFADGVEIDSNTKICGKYGDTISFSGTSSDSEYSERTASGGIASYAFRFKATDATQDQKLFTSDISPYGNRYVKIFNSGKGIAAYTGEETSGYTHNINSDNSQYFQNNQYHHIVVSAQTPFTGPASTNYKVYVDGALILSVSGVTTQEQYTSFITTFNLGIGKSSSEPLTGEMRDIYLFDSTITAAQATELNNGNLPSALSGNVVFSAAITSKIADLHITNPANAKLIINSDTPNDNENANPYLILAQDGDNMIGGMHLDVNNNLNIVAQGSPHTSPAGDNLYDINFKTSSTVEESYTATDLPWQTTTTRMVIKNSGRVGIGGEPYDGQYDKFHVHGITTCQGPQGISLRLVGTNHTYIAFYPDGLSNGRKAYFGFPGETDNNLTIRNEIPNEKIKLISDTIIGDSNVPCNLHCTGDIFMQGNKKLHIGSYDATNPTGNDTARLYIGGDHNLTETFAPFIKLDGYNNDATHNANTKVVVFRSENQIEDYYFKSCKASGDEFDGLSYYRGRVSIGEENPTAPLTVNITSTHYGGSHGGTSRPVVEWKTFDSGGIQFYFSEHSGHDKNLGVRMINNSGVYHNVGYFENSSDYGQFDFTGQHRCLSYERTITVDHYGLIVYSTGDYINIDNEISPTMNNSLPLCNLTNTENDKRVFGVISDEKDDNNERKTGWGVFKTVEQKGTVNEKRLHINGIGEGSIWICNKNGNIENGDYITTGTVPGYGVKQSDDLLHNYTVAKITCECNFSLEKKIKMKIKTRNIITTTEVPETKKIIDKIPKKKVVYDEDKKQYVYKTIIREETKQVPLYDTFNFYDEDGNIIKDEDGNPKIHEVPRMKTITENKCEIIYDDNGRIQYEKDLDENGQEQLIYEYDTRFLLNDGTILKNEEEYNLRLNNGEEVFIACFVGCTYHCS